MSVTGKQEEGKVLMNAGRRRALLSDDTRGDAEYRTSVYSVEE